MSSGNDRRLASLLDGGLLKGGAKNCNVSIATTTTAAAIAAATLQLQQQ